jgi:hypothetical protein
MRIAWRENEIFLGERAGEMLLDIGEWIWIRTFFAQDPENRNKSKNRQTGFHQTKKFLVSTRNDQQSEGTM